MRSRSIRLGAGSLAISCAVSAAGCVIAWRAPDADGSPASRHPAHRPNRRPTPFDLTLSVSGQYTYHYTAQGGPASNRTITFFPSVTYSGVVLYARKSPPASRRKIAGKRGSEAELIGNWSIAYIDPSGEDSCQASGGIAPNPAGSGPLLSGRYVSHVYALSIQGAASVSPFVYTGLEIGGPCGTTDPWAQWVATKSLPASGANAFAANLSISERTLRSIAKGRQAALPVALSPSNGLTSTDCGSAPELQVSCEQAFSWTGTVTISRGKRSR